MTTQIYVHHDEPAKVWSACRPLPPVLFNSWPFTRQVWRSSRLPPSVASCSSLTAARTDVLSAFSNKFLCRDLHAPESNCPEFRSNLCQLPAHSALWPWGLLQKLPIPLTLSFIILVFSSTFHYKVFVSVHPPLSLCQMIRLITLHSSSTYHHHQTAVFFFPFRAVPCLPVPNCPITSLPERWLARPATRLIGRFLHNQKRSFLPLSIVVFYRKSLAFSASLIMHSSAFFERTALEPKSYDLQGSAYGSGSNWLSDDSGDFLLLECLTGADVRTVLSTPPLVPHSHRSVIIFPPTNPFPHFSQRHCPCPRHRFVLLDSRLLLRIGSLGRREHWRRCHDDVRHNNDDCSRREDCQREEHGAGE